ncbi:uncharacterized protein LOC134842168 [Symsagittifera roscoffensis]|uniref:uncharacterized protein LOC134842168 n=1 Tax=Symsagittifera roscoffensis TaxID=84072 RepID=UPI00307B16E2
MFQMQVRMSVAKHDLFTAGCCYYFGASVRFNEGEELWVSQVGVPLKFLPLNEDEFLFEISDIPLAFPRVNGGSGSQQLTIVFPYSSISLFRVHARVKPLWQDKLCMCNIGVLFMDTSFLGCYGTEFPQHEITFQPPYNDTVCKHTVTIDFGPLTKVGAAGPLDEIHFVVTFMTRNSDFGASMSEFIEYTVDSEGDRPTVVKDSSTTRLTGWDGGIHEFRSVNVSFDYVGPQWGLSFAASALFIPYAEATSENGFHVTAQLTFPSDALVDVRPAILLEEVGSSCVPLQSSFNMEADDVTMGATTTATAEWVPISVTSANKANFKVSILATFSRELAEDEFFFVVYVNGETCDTCYSNVTLTSEQPAKFRLLEDPVPQVEMTDPFIVPGYPADESVVYLNGWGVLRFRIQFPPGNAILYENTKVTFEFDPSGAGNSSLSPSALELVRVSLSHVGDNMPSLQHWRNDKEPSYDHATVEYFVWVQHRAQLDLGSISFLPLNVEDTRDSLVIVSLDFKLNQAAFVDASWQQVIYASLSFNDQLVLGGAMKVLVISDPDTSELIELDHLPQDLILEVFDGVTDAVGAVPGEDPDNTNPEFYLILPSQVMILETKYFVRSLYAFNEYYLKYEVSQTANAGAAYICRTDLEAGRNVVYDVIEQLDGSTTLKISNKDSYINETIEDYQIHLYHIIQAPPQASAVLQAQLEITVSFLPRMTEDGPYMLVGSAVEHRKIIVANNLQLGWLSFYSRLTFLIEDSLVNETLQARLGGSVLLPLRIYLPPKSLGTYAVQVTTSRGVRIHSIFMIGVGAMISPGCYNRSETVLGDEELSYDNDGVHEFSTRSLSLGYLNNIIPTRAETPDEVKHDHNMVTVQIELAVLELTLEPDEQFEVLADLVDDGNADKIYGSWSREVALQTNFTEEDLFEPGVINTRFGRNISVDELNDAYAGDDHYFFVTIDFLRDYNYDTRFTVESELVSSGGAKFVVRGIEIVSWGSNLEASMQYDPEVSEVFVTNDMSENNEQENRMTLHLGRITKLDKAERLGSKSDSNWENQLTLRVALMAQDEALVGHTDTVDVHWAITAEVITLSSGVYQYQAMYDQDRLPILSSNVTVLNTLPREYEQGDSVWYVFSIWAECHATAEAKNVQIRQFLPDFFEFEQYHATLYIGQRPVLDTSDKHVMEFTIERLKLTDYVEWRMLLTVVVGHSFFQDIRLYYHSTPLDTIFFREERDTDTLNPITAGKPYGYKMETIRFQSIVLESVCSGNLIDLSDETKFHECQFRASSTLHPVTYSRMKATPATETLSWKSNTWYGQWQGSQSVTVAMLDKWKLARLVFNEETSVSALTLFYSSDPEGVFWTQYRERDKPYTHMVNESHPLGKFGKHKLRYFDIAYPIKSTWLRLQFNELDRDTLDGRANIAAFRFDIYGCLEKEHDANSGIERACPQKVVVPEAYDRGFLVDHERRVLYVCEKDLHGSSNKCMRMMMDEVSGHFVWSRLPDIIHSVIGYLFDPHFRVFAVGQSMMAYLSSDDAGITWRSAQTQDWWEARRESSKFFAPAVVIPDDFPSVDPRDVGSELTLSWSDIDFRANQDGIWMLWHGSDPDDLASYRMVYSWSRCCAG